MGSKEHERAMTVEQMQQPRRVERAVINPLQQMQQRHPTRSERNIRNQPFGWQALVTIECIQQHFDEGHCATAVALYTALTLLASQQRTPGQCHTSAAYLGAQIKVSESTARRYLHDFEELGLIEVVAGRHAANTYILLDVEQPTPTGFDDVPLADAKGISRGVMGDTLPYRVATAMTDRGSTHATPEPSRGSTHDSQCITSDLNKEQIQQPTNGGGGVMDVKATRPDRGTVVERQIKPLDQGVVSALCRLGIRRGTAEGLAAQHDVERVTGWARYARDAQGLKNRAGFVITRLKAGDPPPSAAERFGVYVAAPIHSLEVEGWNRSTADDVQGSHCDPLPEPLPQEGGANFAPPLTSPTVLTLAQARDVWRYSAGHDLRRSVGQAVWLKHFAAARLVGVEGSDWLLADTAGQAADGYRQQLETVLRRATGQPVALRYV